MIKAFFLRLITLNKKKIYSVIAGKSVSSITARMIIDTIYSGYRYWNSNYIIIVMINSFLKFSAMISKSTTQLFIL